MIEMVRELDDTYGVKLNYSGKEEKLPRVRKLSRRKKKSDEKLVRPSPGWNRCDRLRDNLSQLKICQLCSFGP